VGGGSGGRGRRRGLRRTAARLRRRAVVRGTLGAVDETTLRIGAAVDDESDGDGLAGRETGGVPLGRRHGDVLPADAGLRVPQRAELRAGGQVELQLPGLLRLAAV